MTVSDPRRSLICLFVPPYPAGTSADRIPRNGLPLLASISHLPLSEVK
jgi:hypothetical protein